MRIIAGKWRSRRLARPQGRTTRPIPDRVRETVFNILGSHYDCPGALPGLHVADVFAGSGSMGFEALSRGAASCCFFERDREALDALARNRDALRVGPEATVVRRDAWSSAILTVGGRPYDLYLLDPPYADTQDVSKSSPLWRYLGRIAMCRDERPLVVLHHHSSVRVDVESAGDWRIMDRRTLGTNAITMFVR